MTENAESVTVEADCAAETWSVYVETEAAETAGLEEADAEALSDDADALSDSATRAEGSIEGEDMEGNGDELAVVEFTSSEGEGKEEGCSVGNADESVAVAGAPDEAGPSGGSDPSAPSDAADGRGMS